MPITSGTHTVLVQWKNSGSGSVRIRPVTQSDAEHAVLIIQEVSN
jgi:hypothetical protein